MSKRRQIICKTCKSPAIQDGNKITCEGCGLETDGLSFAWLVKQVNNEQKEEKTAMTEKTNAVPEQTGEEQKKRGRPVKECVKAEQNQGKAPDLSLGRPDKPSYDEGMRKDRTPPVFRGAAENVIILDFTGREELLKKLLAFGEEELRSPHEQALWFVREALQVFGE